MKHYSSLIQVQNECQVNSRYLVCLQELMQRLLVVYLGTVYDITNFQMQHPGGKGVLHTYKGKDIGNVLFNPAIHRHSRGVLDTLSQFKCGTIEESKTLTTNYMSASNATNVSRAEPQQQKQSKNQDQKALKQVNQQKGVKTDTAAISRQPKTPIQKEVNAKKAQSNQPIQRATTASDVRPKSESKGALDQSFSKLNQSMTSSQKFLLIPSQSELVKQQKEKQAKLMQQWKQQEIEEKKQQIERVRQEAEYSRRVQSEIILPNQNRFKSQNPYYQNWLNQTKPQQKSVDSLITSTSSQIVLQSQNIVQLQQKKVNPFYENWKKQQEQRKIQQITEVDESQLSISSANNSFRISQSCISSMKSIVQESSDLHVPQFSPKLLKSLQHKFKEI